LRININDEQHEAKTMTLNEMTAALAAHGVHVEPIIPKGSQVPTSYRLRGPRGRNTCVCADANGNVDASSINLWVAAIAYGNTWLAKRVPYARPASSVHR
jgi:hypothetical protein